VKESCLVEQVSTHGQGADDSNQWRLLVEERLRNERPDFGTVRRE